MGWPKGKPRKPPPFHKSDDLVPSEVAAFIAEFGSNIGDPVAHLWSRSDHLRQQEAALFKFVESGEHIEADKYHPGLKDRAEQLYRAIGGRDQKLNEVAAKGNTERAELVEARRQWIVEHCKESVFDMTRKRGIADIQDSLSVAGLTVPSVKRLYADIAAIRAGWGELYFSRAQDKA